MGQIFDFDLINLLSIVVRTLVVYFVLLVGLRIAGKRELGQMTTFDLVVVLVIANAVQNAMVGPDTSLNGGLLAAITLLAVNRAVGQLGIHFSWLHEHLTGNPTILIHDGEFVTDHLRREGLTQDVVMQALREHGVDNLAEVKLAVLEVDGTISVVPVEARTSRTRRRLRGRKPMG